MLRSFLKILQVLIGTTLKGKSIIKKIHKFMPIDELHDFLMIGARTLKAK